MVHWNNCFANANLSLCGCGFLCIYHAGVCAALRVYAPQLTRNKIYGASAGSIAAAGLICNVSIADATAAILQVVAEARSGVLQAFSPTFDLMGIVRDELNRVLPEDAHQLCTDRLYISLTRYDDGKNVLISEFSTKKKELIQAIMCSCFIPIFGGYSIPEFRGVKYIDGGFSDNQPIYDQNTITISPFSGESDICPMDHASASILGFVYYNSSIRFNNENFYRFCSCFVPPTQEICSQICRQGFTDALRFLTKNSITPCHRCLSTQSSESLYMPEIRQSTNYFNSAEKFMNDQKSGQQSRKRRRLDSQCEICLNQLEQRLSTEMTTALFPEVLHKTLQKPVNTSNFASQLFNYAHSFRIVRFWFGLFNQVIRYAEFAIFVLKMLNDFLRKTPKQDFFLTQLQKFVDALLNEVEERNLLCSSPNLSSNQSQFKINRPTQKDKSISIEFLYPIGDFDSFELMKENSNLHELVLADFYTEKLLSPSKKAKYSSPPNLLITPPNPHSSTEKRSNTPTPMEKATSRNVLALKQPSGKSRNESNDSGISSSGFNSSTPAALSSVSSDDGIKKVKKRDVALSPVRNLISAIPRPKFGSRRHTVGVNSGNLAGQNSANGSAASIRRCSTHSLNKSVHSAHSLGGSKHSLMSGGSQGGGGGSSGGHQIKMRQSKLQQPTVQFIGSSSSDCGEEGGRNADNDDDGEQFFVPRTISNVGGGRQQRIVSDAEYDGDADPST